MADGEGEDWPGIKGLWSHHRWSHNPPYFPRSRNICFFCGEYFFYMLGGWCYTCSCIIQLSQLKSKRFQMLLYLSCDFGWASMIEPLSSQSYFSAEPSKVIKCSCLIFGKFIIETRNKVTLYEVIVVREGEVKHIQLIFLNHCLQKERKSNIKSPALNLLDYCCYTSCFNNV